MKSPKLPRVDVPEIGSRPEEEHGRHKGEPVFEGRARTSKKRSSQAERLVGDHVLWQVMYRAGPFNPDDAIARIGRATMDIKRQSMMWLQFAAKLNYQLGRRHRPADVIDDVALREIGFCSN